MMIAGESRGNIDTMMMPGKSGGNIDTMMMPGKSKGNTDTMMMPDQKKFTIMNQILFCFDVHSSATAYQQCKVKIIFLSLMHSTIKVDDTIKIKGEVVLADMLQKSLKGKSSASTNEALPSEFETIGKQITEKCHGLPLTIIVIAGTLKSKKTIEVWENLAKLVILCNAPNLVPEMLHGAHDFEGPQANP
ncbi:hypothetical protein BC332_24415 [Capsicum chinense]|nr:hypothetical protein BC332_24415 [Capsicum chinense]